MPSRAQAAADLEAVRRRDHGVEDDGVVRVGAGALERLVAGRRDVDRVGLLAQAAGDGAGHVGVVFGDEDAHVVDQKPETRRRIALRSGFWFLVSGLPLCLGAAV